MFFLWKINLYWGFFCGIFFCCISIFEFRLFCFFLFVIVFGFEVDCIMCVIMCVICIYVWILLCYFEDYVLRRCKEMFICCVICNLKKIWWLDECKDDIGIFDLDIYVCMLSYVCFLLKEIFDEFFMFLI